MQEGRFPQLVVALDVSDLSGVKRVLSLLPSDRIIFKVGKQLFVSEGPAAVAAVLEAGGRCLLDLKFFDIPHTVKMAVDAATRLGVWGMTLHALGGREMLATAARTARETAEDLGRQIPPRLLAVTVLTSMDAASLLEMGIAVPPEETVAHLARLALDSGMDGVVASPLEAKRLRKTFCRKFLIMTPGVRFSGGTQDDQRRIATPHEAIAAGADLLVMGRAILNAKDPAKAARDVIDILSAELS